MGASQSKSLGRQYKLGFSCNSAGADQQLSQQVASTFQAVPQAQTWMGIWRMPLNSCYALTFYQVRIQLHFHSALTDDHLFFCADIPAVGM
jgi:hypothetical protein